MSLWGRFSRLVFALVSLVLGEVHARPDAAYVLPYEADSLLGQVTQRTLRYEDTFALVAREEGIGYEALRRANEGVDEWIPGAGTVVILPESLLLPDVPREDIVVNLSELRLYYFDPSGGQVFVYPIGIGSQGRETPEMVTRVVAKLQNPSWYPPRSIRDRRAEQGVILPSEVPPGVDNPLGGYAIQLARPGYFIHGTNQPIGVGRRVSSGCLRLYERHIEALVRQVPNGAAVRVIRHPYKVAWHAGALYLEAHPPQEDPSHNHSGFVAQIIRATANKPADIDWDLALDVARAGRGLPVRISR